MRPARRDEAAVSDIIGSVLLVGMTVAMAVGLGALLFAFDGPADTQYTNLSASLDPGPDGQWNSGNEEIRVAHLGGEPLTEAGTTIQYRVGTTSAAVAGAALAFPGDSLTIGERWTRTASFALNDVVQVRVSTADGSGSGGQLLANAAVVAGSTTVGNICLGDVQAPVASITKTPPDLTSASTGPVLVQATLSDNCSGVAAVAPDLRYCIGVSCPAPTVAGTGYTTLAMTRPDPLTQPNLWEATIPAPAPAGSWSVHLGQTLALYLYPLTDSASPANTAMSPQVTDPITVFTQYKYAESHNTTLGSAVDFPNLGADEGAEGSFVEGIASGAAGTTTLNANGVTSSSGWTDPTFATASDGNYAWTAANTPAHLQASLADPSSQPGTITQVVVRAEVNIAGANNDGWQLQACLSATNCNTASASVVGTQADSTVSYDVTALRPGGGTWSWADLNNLQVRVTPTKTGARDGTWNVDNVLASVTYAPTYGMTAQLGFGTVHAGATHTLELEYHVAAGSTFNVQVATGCSPTCTWATVGSPLTSTSLATFTHIFSAAQASAGYAVRIVTPSASQDTTPSQIYLDYARVATTS